MFLAQVHEVIRPNVEAPGRITLPHVRRHRRSRSRPYSCPASSECNGLIACRKTTQLELVGCVAAVRIAAGESFEQQRVSAFERHPLSRGPACHRTTEIRGAASFIRLVARNSVLVSPSAPRRRKRVIARRIAPSTCPTLTNPMTIGARSPALRPRAKISDCLRTLLSIVASTPPSSYRRRRSISGCAFWPPRLPASCG